VAGHTPLRSTLPPLSVNPISVSHRPCVTHTFQELRRRRRVHLPRSQMWRARAIDRHCNTIKKDNKTIARFSRHQSPCHCKECGISPQLLSQVVVTVSFFTVFVFLIFASTGAYIILKKAKSKVARSNSSSREVQTEERTTHTACH